MIRVATGPDERIAYEAPPWATVPVVVATAAKEGMTAATAATAATGE